VRLVQFDHDDLAVAETDLQLAEVTLEGELLDQLVTAAHQ